jgi:CHAT domain-containing protein
LKNVDKTQKLNIANLVLPPAVGFFIQIQIKEGKTFKHYLSTMSQEDKENTKEISDMLFNQIESILLETKNEMDSIHLDSRDLSQSLGNYYFHIQLDNEKALYYYREAIDGLDKNSINYAERLVLIARIYTAMGEFQSAVTYLKQSVNLLKNILNDKNIDLSMPLYYLSFNLFKQGNYQQAFQHSKERFEVLQYNINLLFNAMNESDRLDLFGTFEMNARDIYSILSEYQINEVTQTAYDAALYYKGLLLRSSNRIRESILKSDDNTSKENYKELVQAKKQLKTMPTIPEAASKNDTVSYWKTRKLLTRINNLEELLTQNSIPYREAHKKQTVRWSDVRNKLKNSEIAIEFIISTDTVDNCKYGALLLKKDFKAPVYVPLFKEKQLTDLIDKCGNDINQLYQENGNQLYDMIWKTMEAHLKNVKTIYYSPVKKLYSIAFNALPVPNQNNNQTLSDLYDFRMLSRTSEIVELPIFCKDSLKAELYGDIEYDKDGGRGRWGYVWTDITNIKDLLQQSNKIKIDTLNVYTELDATEETFRKNSGNSAVWLYLITHGEFEKIKENGSNELFSSRFGVAQSDPMNRSMLMMSNANEAWDKVDMKPYESDGVLLASEIAELNLEKTDLLVLAACKTGLGEENETEGIFGLQRAFKLAGVKTIVMTLWEDDVTATNNFMNKFYSNLVNGLDKHQSFINTMDYMKKKYHKPEYWAGFVMLD